MKYHVIVAHPDDELFHMGYFTTTKPGDVILVGGAPAPYNKERLNRFVKFVESIPKSWHRFSFATDYLLSYDRQLLYINLYESVKSKTRQGEYLVTHSYFDTHPEHLLVNSVVTLIAHQLGLGLITSTGHYRQGVQFTQTPNYDKRGLIKKFYFEEYRDLKKSDYFNRFNMSSEFYHIIMRPINV